MSSHHIKQCRLIINWTLGNQLQWNLISNLDFCFNKIYFEISSLKFRPFFSRSKCVENGRGHHRCMASDKFYHENKCHTCIRNTTMCYISYPDSKVLPAPSGPHIGPINLAIRVAFFSAQWCIYAIELCHHLVDELMQYKQDTHDDYVL